MLKNTNDLNYLVFIFKGNIHLNFFRKKKQIPPDKSVIKKIKMCVLYAWFVMNLFFILTYRILGFYDR